MKDKRLDALLATLPKMKCAYYSAIIKDYRGPDSDYIVCRHESIKDAYPPHTDCQGDIRKCEREE